MDRKSGPQRAAQRCVEIIAEEAGTVSRGLELMPEIDAEATELARLQLLDLCGMLDALTMYLPPGYDAAPSVPAPGNELRVSNAGELVQVAS